MHIGVTIITTADDGSGLPMEVRQLIPADSVFLLAYGNGNYGAMLAGNTEPNKVEEFKVFIDPVDGLKWIKEVKKLQVGPLKTTLDNA